MVFCCRNPHRLSQTAFIEVMGMDASMIFAKLNENDGSLALMTAEPLGCGYYELRRAGSVNRTPNLGDLEKKKNFFFFK